MAIDLAGMRIYMLALMGENDINNSMWRHSDATPYYNYDSAILQADIVLGEELLMRGCQDEMTVKSSTVTFPANQSEVAWATLDATGVLPGAKILQIKDTTSDLPMYIRMEYMSRLDRWNPASIYDSPRYRELNRNISNVVAIMYKDTCCIFPKFSSARSLTFYYIPRFGGMTTGSPAVNSPLPNEAVVAMAYRAGIFLKRQLDQDATGFERSYQESFTALVNALQNGRGTPFRRRPRFKGPMY